MSWKTSLLLRAEILGLFGNTLTDDHMYSRHYLREISARCSSTIISKTENVFPNFYYSFAIFRKVCPFWEKGQLHSLNILDVIDSEKFGYFNAREVLLSTNLPESTCSRVLNIAEITMAAVLSKISIDPRQTEFEKISLSKM